MLRFLLPLILCALGTYFSFFRFWNGMDAISGDLGDARFNAYVLEHTWLWLKGEHVLFQMPMFYPATNAYAYSDFMLGFAPIYWFFRALGAEILLSYQGWLITSAVLNFGSFYLLTKKYFNLSVFASALGAFIFAFSLPRITHLEHGQMNAQFFIVLSAMGAIHWWRDPRSKKAPWLFFGGALLQFISAFYFFWFWIWTLGIYGIYVFMNPARRDEAREWFRNLSFSSAVWPFVVSAMIGLPFLYHYALAAKEFGRRDWVSISNTVPRLYSWFTLPVDHWEWSMVPFKSWISGLPMLTEHYLSFGMFTWAGMLAALVWVYRRKPELKYLLIPIGTMFLFTITSGRFSAWVFMSYLFPGGGAIRAVGRIQIYMLFFWALIFAHFFSSLLEMESKWSDAIMKRRLLAVMMLVAVIAESVYFTNWTFSRAEDRARLAQISQKIPADCKILVNPAGFAAGDSFVANIDTVLIAFQTGRESINGYSGHEPANYRDPVVIEKWNQTTELDGKKVCRLQ